MVEITHLDASPDTRVPKASVRAADGTAAAATLGLNFASSEQRGDTLVVRIRPDEWYLLGDGAPAMADGLDLSGFASTVDISHSRTAVRLTGDRAADTLAKLGSADFSDHMTPNGAALGNGIAGVTCDIVRDDQRVCGAICCCSMAASSRISWARCTTPHRSSDHELCLTGV